MTVVDLNLAIAPPSLIGPPVRATRRSAHGLAGAARQDGHAVSPSRQQAGGRVASSSGRRAATPSGQQVRDGSEQREET